MLAQKKKPQKNPKKTPNKQTNSAIPSKVGTNYNGHLNERLYPGIQVLPGSVWNNEHIFMTWWHDFFVWIY